jgi:Exocyst complex component Sec5
MPLISKWDMRVQVKENFDRFISCKNTIDDIHVRLRRTEAEASSTVAVMQVRASASRSRVRHVLSYALWRLSSGWSKTFAATHAQAVSEAHGAATGVFGGMLDRQAQVDRIKGVLAMLKRYESLFRLPTRIRCDLAYILEVAGLYTSVSPCGWHLCVCMSVFPSARLCGCVTERHHDKRAMLTAGRPRSAATLRAWWWSTARPAP